MSRDELEELAALEAAGAASPEDRARLLRLVTQYPDALDQARELADAAALLAEGLEPVPPPPAALSQIRATIQSQATAPPTSQHAADEAPAPAPRETPGADIVSLAERRRKRSLALSVVMAGAAAATTALWLQERGQSEDLRAQVQESASAYEEDNAALRRQVAEARDEAQAKYQTVSAPGVKLAQVRDPKGAKVNIFVDPANRKWLVFAFELPQPAPDKDYQLWFVPPEGKPISAGILELGPDGVLTATPKVPAGLGEVRPAISLEKKGGAQQPTDIKLVGDTIKI